MGTLFHLKRITRRPVLLYYTHVQLVFHNELVNHIRNEFYVKTYCSPARVAHLIAKDNEVGNAWNASVPWQSPLEHVPSGDVPHQKKTKKERIM